MKVFENINITINTDKAMKIFNGSVNLVAGFIGSIGINEIYKRIDKTGVSKGRRYLMDCGIRAITIAATTPYITAGVKQLVAASSDEEKLITIKMREKTATKVPGTPDDAAMMAQKNKITEMIRNLVTQYGDIHFQLLSLTEYHKDSDHYGVVSSSISLTDEWKEFISEVADYNDNLHHTLGDSYEFTTLRSQLIMAGDEIAKEMEKDLGTADKTQQ